MTKTNIDAAILREDIATITALLDPANDKISDRMARIAASAMLSDLTARLDSSTAPDSPDTAATPNVDQDTDALAGTGHPYDRICTAVDFLHLVGGLSQKDAELCDIAGATIHAKNTAAKYGRHYSESGETGELFTFPTVWEHVFRGGKHISRVYWNDKTAEFARKFS